MHYKISQQTKSEIKELSQSIVKELCKEYPCTAYMTEKLDAIKRRVDNPVVTLTCAVCEHETVDVYKSDAKLFKACSNCINHKQ